MVKKAKKQAAVKHVLLAVAIALISVFFFVYAIQSYDLIHDPDLQESIALLFPWLELFAGVFLLLGLWTKAALIGTGAMACGFIIFVGQGITRKLPLVDCGCFGDLAHFPISVTFAIDWAILVCSILLYIKADQTKKMSLDKKLD